MFHTPFRLSAELGIVAVATSHQPHPLDAVAGKRLDRAGADEPHPSNAAAVGAGQVPAIGILLPTVHFVRHAAVVVLEARRALLAGCLRFAAGVEPTDRLPRPVGGGLPCLGVQLGSEREFLGKPAALDLEVVGGGARRVHPETQAFVVHELGSADDLIHLRVLGGGGVNLVLIDQHQPVPACFLSGLLVAQC
jgi:hypothetical protein